MSREATEKLSSRLRDVVNYFAREFNITYAESIGTLQMLMMDLWEDSCIKEDDEDEPI